MRYEVTFNTTYTGDGKRVEHPVELLHLPEGTIREATPVETEQPIELEYPEQTDGEDLLDFAGTETWEFEVVEHRIEDFTKAADTCPEVVQYSEVPEAA
jgi:hypothetical protein